MIHRKKNVILIRCFLIVVILIGSFVLFDILVLEQGRGLYRYNTDIDLNSGVLRKRFYYWIIPVKHEIISTKFSKMTSECLGTQEEAIWKEEIHTVTLSGGKIKKGGRAITSCGGLANAIIVAEFYGNLSEEEKISYLNKALDLLRENRIQDIEDMADELGSLGDLKRGIEIPT